MIKFDQRTPCLKPYNVGSVDLDVWFDSELSTIDSNNFTMIVDNNYG